MIVGAGGATMKILWAIMMAVSLLPMAIRLWKVRQVGRRVHVFDDIVSYLTLPIAFLVPAVPLPRSALYAIGVFLGLSILVSIYRLIRNVGTAREP
ncbi:MAG TPA: hypothetical protein VIQ54_20440 [Polyangia bacterium]|jgi:multisubunit Na+/H+ antiporter MnhF subunit